MLLHSGLGLLSPRLGLLGPRHGHAGGLLRFTGEPFGVLDPRRTIHVGRLQGLVLRLESLEEPFRLRERALLGLKSLLPRGPLLPLPLQLFF